MNTHPSPADAGPTAAIIRPAPVVLVTGGAKRLGAEVCRAFAAAGWRVACHYGASETEAMALHADIGCAPIRGDLSTEPGRLALFDAALTTFGQVDAVVNNASAFEPDTGLTFDPALAQRQMDINLMAPVSLARHLALHAQARGTTGCAVHVLDQKVYNLNPDYFSYSLTKLALERAVGLQAQALAPWLRVCGVAPGLMFESGPQTADNFERAQRVNLLQTPLKAQQVAQTCVFLAENSAITGSTVCVDNGQHLLPLGRDVMFAVDHPAFQPLLPLPPRAD